MSLEYNPFDSDSASQSPAKSYDFPIDFTFKITTLANDFVATDARGKTLAYVRQKMFKLKESVMIYADQQQNQLLYQISADRILDFNTSYQFTNAAGNVIGHVGRHGMRSFWSAHYDILDSNNRPQYAIKELNPWAKVLDGLLGEIPLLALFTGYFFHPKYGVFDQTGRMLVELTKQSSLVGRRFKLEKLGLIPEGDSETILLGLMMMILLEHSRG